MSSGYSPVSTCTVQSPYTGYARVPPTVQSPVFIVLLVRAVSSGYSPVSPCSLQYL